MYPKDIFLGLGMYEILFVLGFIAALAYMRIFFDRTKQPAAFQNLCIFSALFALIGGYGSAILMQACYNALQSGHFEVTKNTGATFYGGFIGGAGCYFLVYFVGGHFRLPKGEAKAKCLYMTDVVAGSVAAAHSLGRLGCLFAGCCHGGVTDAWYGIYHMGLKQKVVPVQLFEAIFLALLCVYLTWRLLHGKTGNLAVYLMIYAVWRFIVEYFRADDRGATVVSFLTPSQLTAVVLFAVGAVVFAWIQLREKRKTHAA